MATMVVDLLVDGQAEDVLRCEKPAAEGITKSSAASSVVNGLIQETNRYEARLVTYNLASEWDFGTMKKLLRDRI